MTLCLDIHTHHPAPQPLGVVSVSLGDFYPLEGQLYSIGFHPWETYDQISTEKWEDFLKKASSPEVVAIGECGIDKIKGGPLFKQMLVLKHQIEISERIGKPLILHDVKAHDVIVGLKRNIQPKQKWVVHGFRAKPSVAKMMTDAGIFLSFGEKFNPDTPKCVPPKMILAETDESPLSISQVIANLSDNLGRDITDLIVRNTANFLYGVNNISDENENVI